MYQEALSIAQEHGFCSKRNINTLRQSLQEVQHCLENHKSDCECVTHLAIHSITQFLLFADKALTNSTEAQNTVIAGEIQQVLEEIAESAWASKERGLKPEAIAQYIGPVLRIADYLSSSLSNLAAIRYR